MVRKLSKMREIPLTLHTPHTPVSQLIYLCANCDHPPDAHTPEGKCLFGTGVLEIVHAHTTDELG
jgi:hypothetical protein